MNVIKLDWHEVYGSVPQSIIDIEKDTLRHLVDSNIDLVKITLFNCL